MQRKKGISLIVLIITIIIMIILASAVILTINNTNIMDRAEDAVNASNEVQMKNLAVLAWSDAYLKGEAKTDEEFETAVRQYMLNAGVTAAELDQYMLEATKEKVNLVKLSTLGSLVTSAADYGKTVNYSANGVNDWEVFYKRTVAGEEYVYLIASENIPVTSYPEDLPNAIYGDDEVYWESAPTEQATIERDSLWMADWGDYSSYENGRFASLFLSEQYWNVFKDPNYGEYVVGAIGTPTLEMFAAYYNESCVLLDEFYFALFTLPLEKGTYGYNIYELDLTNDVSWGGEETTWLASPRWLCS